MSHSPLIHLEPFGLKLDITHPLSTADIDKTLATIRQAHRKTAIAVIFGLALFVSSLISGLLDFNYALHLVFMSILLVFIVCVYTTIYQSDHSEADDLLKELNLHSHSAKLHELSKWAAANSQVKQYLKSIHDAGRKPTIAEFEYIRLYIAEQEWSDALQDAK